MINVNLLNVIIGINVKNCIFNLIIIELFIGVFICLFLEDYIERVWCSICKGMNFLRFC